MTILAVDPNPEDLYALAQCLTHLHPKDDVFSYGDPMLAFQYAFNNSVEAVYTVVNMKRLDGLTLVKMLREDHPDIRIHLIADDDAHRIDAMHIKADSYLVKPVRVEEILRHAAESI